MTDFTASSAVRSDGRPATTALTPWLILASLSIAATMDAVNSTVLVVTRGHLMGGTHATQDEIAWVNMAYVAAKLAALPVAAWMMPRASSSHMLGGAVATLIATSLGCSTTDSVDLLVCWRAIQGAAGAVLLVVGQSLLFAIFPRSRQGIAQAIFAFATIMAPTTITPALQGWIADAHSSSWIFVANVPLGLTGLFSAFLSRDIGARARPLGRFDWAGGAALAVFTTCFVFVTQEGSRHNWFDEPEVVAYFAVGLAAALCFMASEFRLQGRGALVDFGVFRDEHFAFGFVVSFVAGCALFGSALIIPAFAIGVLEFTPAYAGLVLLPSGALVCIGLLAAGGLIDAKGLDPAKPIPLGILCLMAAMWLLSGSTSESGLQDLIPAIMLRGLGLGLLFVSLTLVTLRDLGPETVAQGVALFNVGRQMGGQIGIAWLSTTLDHQNAHNRMVLSHHLAPSDPALIERQDAVTNLLVSRGYSPEEAVSAATAVIQKSFAQQVATLSFNECFLAIALLFVAAAPVLIATKLILGRLMSRHSEHSQGQSV
ncbi:DHA2 family efflux MFS transporter permease subunit [Sinorhizobium meliloti]|uniref:DHA2 family efflux MFS transporter permease subunit n=1 Tax=Rhizobium meliloti TaxID=382 RepID=UPI000FDBB9B0|nr:DHA2 family efflux MFS transporter permease subunit [Sinorhizobium meliloti]MDW9438585.1 DHA2 family efflux MFS transporter permease subunit [Sinorhizobium meliloti]MDW9477943.1 DHA2 family efflux MFS transporter permease subunit [Sinorhizobium meliloti]MDW9547901.1 DHA2 family efflux MFS transporter permease subunit [Sinorhizobium meliloti]MDW9620935.1 DHA2 family efflux MFS transporter permease subunit [Sinorhizobium meliloti]MDX0154689.1 DHA2 family efflux MFS transporter permease subuni